MNTIYIIYIHSIRCDGFLGNLRSTHAPYWVSDKLDINDLLPVVADIVDQAHSRLPLVYGPELGGEVSIIAQRAHPRAGGYLAAKVLGPRVQ